MAEGDFRIFLSAVSSEFGRARDALAADLRARETLVQVQSDFRQESEADTTLRKLHDYIRECSAVVCIIGKRSGAFPPAAAAAPFNSMLPPGIGRASYTQWEFFFARHYKRRLSIYVANDDYPPDKPEPSGEDDPALQMAFVAHIVEGEGLDRDYFSSEDRLCRLVLKEDWPVRMRTPNIDVERDRLPYLANRQPQIWRICSSVAERMNKATGAAGVARPAKPSLFIVPSRQHDVVDMFHWRLVYKDGPQYCELDASRDNPSWVECQLSWPGYKTPASFHEDFVNANIQPARVKLLQSRQRGRPVCFSTWVAFSEIEKEFRQFIDIWIRCWPDLLDRAGLGSPQPERSLPRPPVVGLLVLMFAGGKSGIWPFRRGRDADFARYCGELEALGADGSASAESPTVEVISLPPLGPITFREASEWLALPDILRHNVDRPVRGAVQDMFRDPETRVPMQEFANTILAAIDRTTAGAP